MSSSNQRRLDRLESLVSTGAGCPSKENEAAHKRIREVLDRVVVLRRRQRVGPFEIVPETPGDVEVLAIFWALAERAREKEGRTRLTLSTERPRGSS
jgi:hypothetical protein